MDLLCVLGIVVSFALTWGFVRLCERLGCTMEMLQILGGVLAIALFFYLLFALLAPEKLS